MCLFQLGEIVDTWDSGFALGDEMVVEDVIAEEQFLLQPFHRACHNLVEDVVRPF